MKHTRDFSSRFRILKGGKISLIISALMGSATITLASPMEGTVTTGLASISQSGSVTTINQSTNKASINWQSFSIAPTETVSFVQPSASSVTLNRVVGISSSLIQGAMNANGQVILVNPNGVVFTEGAQVNVSGLIVTTKNITDENFQHGNYVFEGDSSASLLNMGSIHATNGGYVAMMGKTVQNQGTITATLGRVELAGGNKFTLNLRGNSLLNLTIDEGTLNALVANGGIIKADGGVVHITTQALDSILDGVVNNTGVIQAQSMSNQNGEIVLYANGGTLNAGGTLDTGSGTGHVETSGKVFHSDNSLHVTTGSWLIDPTNLTIDSTLATTVQNTLNGGADVIETTTGDITVNSAIEWTTAKTLTLDAGTNIHINADITATNAAGKVVLNYGQGALENGNTATYDFGLTSTGFTGKINLQSGQNFTTKLGSDGTAVNYTVINDANGLIGLTLNDLNVAYALGSNIDLDEFRWTPIGGYSGWNPNPFSGKFDGLGHTVSNLNNIDSSIQEYVGLFGNIDYATIANISVSGTIDGSMNIGGLVGQATRSTIINARSSVNVTGDNTVGGLVAKANETTITNSYATGSVTGNSNSIGGLVGDIGGTSYITNSYATGSVTGSIVDTELSTYNTYADTIGGLAGNVEDTIITNSYATGAVKGRNYVGGLVGNLSYVFITDSYATGTILGTGNYVGGLVGEAYSSFIANSHATGNVSGNERVGGLIGDALNRYYSYSDNTSVVLNSYATGDVSGTDSVGGLVGYILNIPNRTPAYNTVIDFIKDSHATGNVSGTGNVGGLVGYTDTSSINNSYASGIVTGIEDSIGGLVGFLWNSSSIENSYATGDVIGYEKLGGLVGNVRNSTITNSYATGDVGDSTAHQNIGGLVGYSDTSSISNSYATGNAIGDFYVGGLVGYTWDVSINKTYATGGVTAREGATWGSAGGLVGTLDGNSIISNSYATGTVSGDYSGGLIGTTSSWGNSTVSESYSIGAVSGNSSGGFGGILYNTTTLLNNFWDTTTSATSNAYYSASNQSGPFTAVTNDINVVGKTTADMKDITTYSSWLSSNDLVGDESLSNVYPQLRWSNSGLSAGNSIWVIGKAPITYTLTGGTQTYGTIFTLPTPTFSNVTLTSTPTVKVYDSNNNDVTLQAIAGTLPVGTYTVKTLLTDPVYTIADTGNTNGILTITPTPTEQTVNDIVANIVNNTIRNQLPTTNPAQAKGDTPNGFERSAQSSIVNVGSDKSLGGVGGDLNSVIRSVEPSVDGIVKDSKVTLVGETGGEPKITSVELKQILAKTGGGELRVALSPDSFVELINGGVTLPAGVSQEFYVVEDKK